MAVLHQMGHHSNNLVDLPEMSAYAGAIFSPINCTESEVAEQVLQVRKSRENFQAILDPQLYVPATERGKLKKWAYFPKDVDTADLTSMAWWTTLNGHLAGVARKVGVDGICSPVVIPKTFDDKYYAHIVGAGSDLGKRFEGRGMRVLQTVLANFPELVGENRAMEIASIVSRTASAWIYLVFVGIVEPRRELKDVDELKGAMQLIRALERNGIKVLVGFCSSDLLLWKAAGASACASGKFFNLRRFTRQRFEEPNATGGGQLPYWFEEGLLAFLRQGDLIRVRKHNLLSQTSLRNPFAKEILSGLDEATSARTTPRPWLGTSWRQFLYWFADVEGRISRKEITAEELLTTADANWSKLDAAKVLLEERFNDGTWIRDWLNTLHEFQ